MEINEIREDGQTGRRRFVAGAERGKTMQYATQKHGQLEKGQLAYIKNTWQVVEIIRTSTHGISVVAFKTGAEMFMLNNRLEPITSLN